MINSAPVSAAAFDSLSDMGGTTVVLLAVFASQFTAFPLDGAAGLLVAILVLFMLGMVVWRSYH